LSNWEFSKNVAKCVCYLQNSPVKIQTPTHFEHDRTQQDNPAARVVAQQYASITFVLMRFLSSKEIFGGVFRNIVYLL